MRWRHFSTTTPRALALRNPWCADLSLSVYISVPLDIVDDTNVYPQNIQAQPKRALGSTILPYTLVNFPVYMHSFSPQPLKFSPPLLPNNSLLPLSHPIAFPPLRTATPKCHAAARRSTEPKRERCFELPSSPGGGYQLTEGRARTSSREPASIGTTRSTHGWERERDEQRGI